MKLRSEVCGRFTLLGKADAMDVDADDSLLLLADRDYVVKVPARLSDLPLAGALRRLPGASEAVLRFSGFIGDTHLDGRTLRVRSPKLTAKQVDGMLRSVAGKLAALPFAFTAPTGARYARDVTAGPDIAYQAVVLILAALEGRGRHDLRGAMARILANPHTVLRAERAIVPLPLADRLGATSLLDAVTSVNLSPVLPAGHPLADSPVAAAFRGRVPERLSVERVRPELDNLENRFVAGVLDTCLQTVDVVVNLARESKAPGAAALEHDCFVAGETLGIWRSHRVLEPLGSHGSVPLGSTVLQRKPGYRDVLAFWMDLIGRTRWLPPRVSASLLALRDAPTLYEYWCYFEVVAAVESVEGPPVAVSRPVQDEAGARLAWSSNARFASGATVVFNERFPGRDAAAPGPKSSSVPLRPDVVLRHPSAGFHVLDAKFRRAGVLTEREDEAAEGGEDAAQQADVHKMHAYRDALGARSAWVLYPGQGAPAEFPPSGAQVDEHAPPNGVGTIALTPGSGGADNLRGIVERMLRTV
ncbi:MAG: DUF2357 domain-containing protein [Actinomycetota bacterium]|nr:DUF2357 domain-containing protein [Actinomycetota bacterium]